ncbi:MAG TPA: TIGR01906 family membrane protein [Anaerolineaceae bacterium]|nr:TIGR01906 family membrane protein [Anaerolineaceae bacterium]
MKTVYRHIMFLAFILVILIAGIRFCLTHTFIDLEYAYPAFPDDTYGFSRDTRTVLAYQSVDYLLGKLSDADYQALATPDGKPLFNQRELSHMRDVRDLTHIVLAVWYASIAVMAAGIVLALKLHWQTHLLEAGKLASKIIFFFIVFVLLAVLLNFDRLFTIFHSLFFEGDTWLFYPSDSLIRLFPTPFWVNVFITVGIISFTLAFFLHYACGSLLKKKERVE